MLHFTFHNLFFIYILIFYILHIILYIRRHLYYFCLQIEGIYKSAHEAIRANPEHTKIVKEKIPVKKRWNRRKLSLAERKNCVAQRKANFLKKLAEVEA